MGEREKLLFVLVYLLMGEVQCLRSVLSEYDKDHNQFTQWMKAEDLRQVIQGMEHRI